MQRIPGRSSASKSPALPLFSMFPRRFRRSRISPRRHRADVLCCASTGTMDRQPAEQELLANSDNVKLRLGVVNDMGRQKGVDSLIVTDLIALARNQAVTDAVLLSGDKDVRIGVEIAQGYGVRVHLVGTEPSRASQSNALHQESDTKTEIKRGPRQSSSLHEEAMGTLWNSPGRRLPWRTKLSTRWYRAS